MASCRNFYYSFTPLIFQCGRSFILFSFYKMMSTLRREVRRYNGHNISISIKPVPVPTFIPTLFTDFISFRDILNLIGHKLNIALGITEHTQHYSDIGISLYFTVLFIQISQKGSFLFSFWLCDIETSSQHLHKNVRYLERQPRLCDNFSFSLLYNQFRSLLIRNVCSIIVRRIIYISKTVRMFESFVCKSPNPCDQVFLKGINENMTRTNVKVPEIYFYSCFLQHCKFLIF